MVEVCEGNQVKPSDTYRWQKQWRVERNRGLKRTTGPERAQAHVQELTNSLGVSIRAIADASGTSPAVISELNRGICHGLMVRTEKAILAVKPEDILGRPNLNGSVPNIGTRRRIQALMAMGWRHQDLTPLLGFNSGNVVHQAGNWITRRKHEATKGVYDRLWNQRGPATRISLARVAKAGYAPPLAWDDDSIDDPNAEPDLGAKVYAQGRPPAGAIRRSEAIVEDVEFLLNDGHTWSTIPDRLGTTPAALDRQLHREGRSDLINRAKTMTDRLAYARAS